MSVVIQRRSAYIFAFIFNNLSAGPGLIQCIYMLKKRQLLAVDLFFVAHLSTSSAKF